VRCTITGNAGYAGWIAKRLAIPDLHKRLKAGEHVTVFKFPRNGYRIKWPRLATGEVFKIGQGEAPDWVVGFNPPRGQASDVVLDGQLAVDRLDPLRVGHLDVDGGVRRDSAPAARRAFGVPAC
jgi:hypothetical protein